VTGLGRLRPEGAEIGQRDALLDCLKRAGIDGDVLRALASRPDELSRLLHAIAAGGFAADPEVGENIGLHAVFLALQAVPALAGYLNAARAGRRSGEAREGENTERDADILELWEVTGTKLHDMPRAERVLAKLKRLARERKRTYRVPKSAKTILRVIRRHTQETWTATRSCPPAWVR
jgi:hypothetical protein